MNEKQLNRREMKRKLIARDGLRCAVSGESVDDESQLEIHFKTPLSKGGKEELSNMMLVRPEINRLLSDTMNFKMLDNANIISERQNEVLEYEKRLFEREAIFRKQLEQQQRLVDEEKKRLERDRFEIEIHYNKQLSEYKSKISALQEELESQKFQLAKERALIEAKLMEKLEHEVKSFNKQKDEFESFSRDRELKFLASMNEINLERERFEDEKRTKEAELKVKFDELEKEREQYKIEIRRELETKSTSYVADAIDSLKNSAKSYQRNAFWWSLAGAISLLLGIGVAIYFGINGLGSDVSKQITWAQLSYLTFKGVIVVGLFVALAKYAFMYGQSFTHETLKIKERMHAINFGKFYLEAYGANADWLQIKEAFANWNIQSTSAFMGQDPDKFDPKSLEKSHALLRLHQKFAIKLTTRTEATFRRLELQFTKHNPQN